MVTDSGEVINLEHISGQTEQRASQDVRRATTAEVRELFNRGFAFAIARQYRQALNVFNEAICSEPMYVEAYIGGSVIDYYEILIC